MRSQIQMLNRIQAIDFLSCLIGKNTAGERLKNWANSWIWRTVNCRFPFKISETIDSVLDKGTLDALMSSDSNETSAKAEMYFKVYFCYF